MIEQGLRWSVDEESFILGCETVTKFEIQNLDDSHPELADRGGRGAGRKKRREEMK